MDIDNITVSTLHAYSIKILNYRTVLDEAHRPLRRQERQGNHLVDLQAMFVPQPSLGYFLTHLADSYDSEDGAMLSTQGGEDHKEYPCLIRATDGKAVQFSTRVCILLKPTR